METATRQHDTLIDLFDTMVNDYREDREVMDWAEVSKIALELKMVLDEGYNYCPAFEENVAKVECLAEHCTESDCEHHELNND